MVAQVAGRNCAEAWARGVLAVADNGVALSPLVTEIEDPCAIHPDWWRSLSPKVISRPENSLHSVVEMVGPVETGDPALSRAEVYRRVWAKYDRCRARGLHLSNWRDTYFERLTRSSNGTNRLETIIDKMNNWNGRRVAPFYAHTTSNTQDNVVPIGSPCLQYVQFLQREGIVLDMVAVYRNHDFFRKALGNYIGLGRLLAYVARETSQTPGKLTCFSANAYIENKNKICALAQSVLQQ